MRVSADEAEHIQRKAPRVMKHTWLCNGRKNHSQALEVECRYVFYLPASDSTPLELNVVLRKERPEAKCLSDFPLIGIKNLLPFGRAKHLIHSNLPLRQYRVEIPREHS